MKHYGEQSICMNQHVCVLPHFINGIQWYQCWHYHYCNPICTSLYMKSPTVSKQYQVPYLTQMWTSKTVTQLQRNSFNSDTISQQPLDLLIASQIFCWNRCRKFQEWHINKQALFSQDVVSSSHNTIWVDSWQVIYTEFQITLLEGKGLG